MKQKFNTRNVAAGASHPQLEDNRMSEEGNKNQPAGARMGRWMPWLAGLIPALYCVGALAFLAGQTVPSEENDSGSKVAHFRYWAVLGDLSATETYTLMVEPAEATKPEERRTVFSGLKGCRRSGFNSGYERIKPGRQRLMLFKDGDAPLKVAEADLSLKAGEAGTLIATLVNGEPKLDVVMEHPALPEQQGVMVFNLLPDQKLSFELGNLAAQEIPFSGGSPFHLTPERVTGQELTLIFSGKGGKMIRRVVDVGASATARTSVVFMRNAYSRPAVFVYPGRPTED